ncbi:biotin--[acetyl-CoA-carboxylase] ligase [Plantactinospora sp. GCM10030261]|uniref:biotin--[acetyl-CoA-carboxylase] ligase n=1 Tax=Plantactinospora sp. GCM10030261 TaxID=3273420 RepID=UPI00360C1231
MAGSPYTDLDRPPLDGRRLGRALTAPAGPWRRFELVAETGSTNADVAAAARAGEPAGYVLVAERQSAGRGRRGRSWESPARAGLATSVLLRPGLAEPERDWPAAPSSVWGWLPLLAGVALVETVTRVAELDAVLKWPNDLLLGDAKCAGILAEAVPAAPAGPPVAAAPLAGPPAAAASSAGPPAIVLGVGLNVTLRAGELPANPTGMPATSLALAGAVATDRDPLLRELLRRLAAWYDRWRSVGGDPEECGLRSAYLRCCATVGREVRVLLPGGAEVRGTASTVDGDGRLVVNTGGTDHAIPAGDVLHLR